MTAMLISSLLWPKRLVKQGEDIVERRFGGGPIVFLDQILQSLDGNSELGDVAIRWRLTEQAPGAKTFQFHASSPSVM